MLLHAADAATHVVETAVETAAAAAILAVAIPGVDAAQAAFDGSCLDFVACSLTADAVEDGDQVAVAIRDADMTRVAIRDAVAIVAVTPVPGQDARIILAL